MPKVPRLVDQQTGVRAIQPGYESLAQSNAVSIAADGVQRFGANLGNIGGQLGAIAKEERQKTQNALLMGARSKLGRWYMENVADPEKGFLAKRGENAMGQGDRPLSDEYLEKFDGFAGDIGKELGDPEVQQAFKKILDQERETIYREMSGHERRESEGVAQANFRSSLDTSVSNAALRYNPRDLEAYDVERRMGEQALLVWAKRQGWSPEVLKDEQRTFRTRLHATVLKKLTDPDSGNAELAAKYLEEYGPEIDGQFREDHKLDEVVAKAGIRVRALVEADKIVQKNGPLNEAAQLADVETIADPLLRDAVDGRIRQRLGMVKAIRQEELKQLYGGVRSQIEQSGGWLDETTPDFLALDRDGQADARGYARNVRYQLGQGSPQDRKTIDTDNKLAKSAFQKLINDNPQQAASLNIADTYRRADDVTRAEIEVAQARLVRDIREKKMATRSELKDVITEATKGAKKDAKGKIEAAMWEFYNNHETRPTDEEVRKKRDELVSKYRVERSWLPDKTVSGYELTEDEKSKAVRLDKSGNPVTAPGPVKPPKPTIPKIDRVRQLKAAGVPPAEAVKILTNEGY